MSDNNDHRLEEGRTPGALIPIHFDVDGHELSFATFVATGRAIEQVISGVNSVASQGKLDFELRVLPPKEGGFWELFWIVIGTSSAGVWTASWKFLEWLGTEDGRKFLIGYTQKEDPEVFRELGEKVRQIVDLATQNARSPAKGNFIEVESRIFPAEGGDTSPPDSLGPDANIPREVTDKEIEANTAVAAVLAYLARELLIAPRERFEKATPQNAGGRQISEGRNMALRAWKADKSIRAVGFRPGDGDPIKRSHFEREQVAVPTEAESIYYPFTEEFVVDSPVFDPHNNKRGWHATDTLGHRRLFSVHDDAFWKLVEAKDRSVSASGSFSIGVQGVYQVGKSGPKNTRVLLVNTFNGTTLRPRVSHEELLDMVGQQQDPLASQNTAPDLFDMMKDE